MNRTRSKTVMMVAGLGFAITAVDVSARDAGADLPLLLTAPGASEEIPETTCGNRIARPEVVLILNDKGRLLRDLGNDQDIKRNIKKGAADVDPPSSVGTLWPTNLDFRVGNNNSTTHYVPIKIVLRPTRKNDTIFLRPSWSADPQADSNSAAAVTVKKGSEDRFCGRKTIGTMTVGKKTYETVSFGSILNPGEYTSINIGILIYNNEDDSWYPVYIDPNIRNEG